MQSFFDTICAISTPLSYGAIGIIRVSGDKAFDIVQAIFSKKIDKTKINHGWILKNGKKFDEVIVLPFCQPKSFTGEDVVEIQTHGSPVVLREILDMLLQNGAVMATRGEFSKRAFLNHKIDMTEAEAILDIINAKTEKFVSASAQNLSGVLKNEIYEIKKIITEIFAKITASVDFPEDVKEVPYPEIKEVLETAKKRIENILKNAKSHNILRDGVKVAILGDVNVGKSSLFNALLSLNRAIVTDIAGTTRDTIFESFDINGILITLIDTAGIRKSEDKVEMIGVDFAKESIKSSDLVLCLFDGNLGFKDKDKEIFELAKDKEKIYVATKSDIKKFKDKVSDENSAISVSSKTNEGIDELKNEIYNKITKNNFMETDFSTNLRQQKCLSNSLSAISNALFGVENSEMQDLILIDIKSAILSLDEITGEVLTDNILDDIFSNFCIGK